MLTSRQLDIVILSGSIIGLSLVGFGVGEQLQFFSNANQLTSNSNIHSSNYNPFPIISFVFYSMSATIFFAVIENRALHYFELKQK